MVVVVVVWLLSVPASYIGLRYQAPPSMGISSKNTEMGCMFPCQGIFKLRNDCVSVLL